MRLRDRFQTTLVLEPHDGFANFQHVQNNCGSGLAREEVVSATIKVDCQTAFASKPAPTS